MRLRLVVMCAAARLLLLRLLGRREQQNGWRIGRMNVRVLCRGRAVIEVLAGLGGLAVRCE